MDSKYLIVGGISIIAIFVFGIGLYIYGNQSEQTETLGVKDVNQAEAKTKNTTGGENKINSMQAEEFKNAVDSGEHILVDIRTAEEYASGHIAGASQTDFYQTQEFDKYLDSLDKNKKYLVYCRSGNRSGQVLNIMKGKGFTNVSDLAGGIGAWNTAGFPIEN